MIYRNIGTIFHVHIWGKHKLQLGTGLYITNLVDLATSQVVVEAGKRTFRPLC